MSTKQIAIVSLHNANFQSLANLTWPNKVKYAERYGYQHYCKTDGFTFKWVSGEKFPMIKEYMLSNPDVEWIWWLDTDTMITDYTKCAEDYLDDNYHFIISTDVDHNDEPTHDKDLYSVNAGSFFIRNSPQGHAYLNWMLSVYEQFELEHGWWTEQRVIDASLTYPRLKQTWSNLIKVCPQHQFNSFDCGTRKFARDLLGERADWEPGDFVVHWPGVGLDTKLKRAVYYQTQIIK